jgi:hypothetical protein
VAWSGFARAKARENFWKPVFEQAGLLREIYYSGECDFEGLIDGLSDYVDSSIFGNRLYNPVSYNALVKVLRDTLGFVECAA